ncbi:DUF423 domain-containing protein [Caldalkalibacillus thermarum TA2.A1]|nr:DUF423 domain-containing protein [Caldalkalibacillus thermarum TA2.A1]
MACLGVALGAFGAHGLKGKLSPEMLEIYQTGVQYHLVHALGLILVGVLVHVMPSNLLNWAGWILALGILLFSGSLYVLSMTGITKLGAITPIGGVAFLTGWILVVLAALR